MKAAAGLGVGARAGVAGVAGTGGAVGSAWAQSGSTVALTPFVEPLPIMPTLPARPLGDGGLQPPPRTQPQRALNPATGLPYEGRGDAHQWRALAEPQRFFVQRYGAVPPARIHPQLPLQTVLWGANLGGADLRTDRPTTPLPTIVVRYQAGANTAVLVRRHNQLPTSAPAGAFGKNQISVHTHNFHSAPDSDGGPCDPGLGALSEIPLQQGRFFFPGQYYDYYYNLKRSGFSSMASRDGDITQTLGSMWYHDHREGHTAENVYKGLYGFFIAFSERDTGDERTGLRLPSYPAYDLPLAIVDARISPQTGQLAFDPADGEGGLGQHYLVNGKVQPYAAVQARRYRLRLLNVGPVRFMQLHLTNPDNPAQVLPFWVIATDGNLLPRPLQKTATRLTPGNRRDVVVDFGRLAAMGVRRVWLENRLPQSEARRPDDGLLPAGRRANALIEFRIGAAAADASLDLATASYSVAMPNIGAPQLTRYFKFGRNGGEWVMNNRPIDCNAVRFTMQLNRTERWVISGSGGWAHPIHVHNFWMRMVSRNGRPVAADSEEYGRQDVLWLGAGDEVEVLVQPQDHVGVYPMHCHNVVHEDFAMMLLFRVAAQGDRLTEP